MSVGNSFSNPCPCLMEIPFCCYLFSHHHKDQCRYAPSQWEMLLHCNDIFHWLVHTDSGLHQFCQNFAFNMIRQLPADFSTRKCFQHYCPFVREIHQLLADSPHKGTVMLILYVSLMSLWTSCWTIIQWLVILEAMLLIWHVCKLGWIRKKNV